jgi:hypothetical protein
VIPKKRGEQRLKEGGRKRGETEEQKQEISPPGFYLYK